MGLNSQKRGIVPKTLDSVLMQEAVRAVSHLDDNFYIKGNYFVVGGTAVQSYLPKEHHRPSSDVDICVARPINGMTEFKQAAAPVIEYLQDNGYEVSFKKSSANFKIIVDDSDSRIFIELSRRNPKKYAKVKKRILRELDHARRKSLANVSIVVSSPEDIAVPKLVRGVGSVQRHPILKEDVYTTFGSESTMSFSEILLYAIESRILANNAESYNSLLTDWSRLVGDLYDVQSLSVFTGFNESYFNKAVSEWDKKTKTEEWKYLCKTLSIPI